MNLVLFEPSLNFINKINEKIEFMLKPKFNDCKCDNLSAKSLSYFCYLDLDESYEIKI